MIRLCCCLFLIAFANFAQNAAVPEARSNDEGFELALTLKNGHIGQVFIGCRPGASDGFDNKLDQMAPPPGIGTGYTFLVSPDRKSNLYKDLRAPGKSAQWVLFARPGGKPVSVSWDKTKLPDNLNLYCARWDGKSADVTDVSDCREVSSISTESLCYFRFWIAPR